MQLSIAANISSVLDGRKVAVQAFSIYRIQHVSLELAFAANISSVLDGRKVAVQAFSIYRIQHVSLELAFCGRCELR
jgi:hypothetical protein